MGRLWFLEKKKGFLWSVVNREKRAQVYRSQSYQRKRNSSAKCSNAQIMNFGFSLRLTSLLSTKVVAFKADAALLYCAV